MSYLNGVILGLLGGFAISGLLHYLCEFCGFLGEIDEEVE